MSASISGSRVTFNVQKQSGTFSKNSQVYLKVGAPDPWGVNHGSSTIYAGQSGTSFVDDLSQYSSGWPTKAFYIRIENSDGIAWAGPIYVTRTEN